MLKHAKRLLAPVRRERPSGGRIQRSIEKRGAPPGVLMSLQSEPTRARLLSYTEDFYAEDKLEITAGFSQMWDEGQVHWVDVVGLEDVDKLKLLGDELKLHPLALEDATTSHQRPKADGFPENLFVTLRMPSLTKGSLELEQVSIFLGKNFVMTVQEHQGDCLDSVRRRIRDGLGIVRTRGADYLAYAIIDAIIDEFFPVVDHYGNEIEQLELSILNAQSTMTMKRLYGLRVDLLYLRKIVYPLRDMLKQLSTKPEKFVDEETVRYLRDCYDHTARIVDFTESHRDLNSGLMELYITLQGHRMNEVMKVLTLIATIFIPLGFIAGLYGMNFDQSSPWNMPETKWRYGYFFALGIMLTTALGLVWFFRRRGWFKRDD